jgi:hypothetical protein
LIQFKKQEIFQFENSRLEKRHFGRNESCVQGVFALQNPEIYPQSQFYCTTTREVSGKTKEQ